MLAGMQHFCGYTVLQFYDCAVVAFQASHISALRLCATQTT